MTVLNAFGRIKSALRPPASYTGPSGHNDIDSSDLAFIRRFDGYTMTSVERRFHLLNAVRYLVRHQIPGAIVECGVWRGGSMMLVASTLLDLGVRDRELHLFDTYAGMPPPAPFDVDFAGRKAADRMQADAETRSESALWAIASLSHVTKNILETGYPAALVHFVEGMVEETLPREAPERIALLRLDTDWYESTRHELIHLYPRLVRGGVLIIDDYGYWKGARKAVDEFLAALPEPVLLHRIDDTGRAAVKS